VYRLVKAAFIIIDARISKVLHAVEGNRKEVGRSVMSMNFNQQSREADNGF
jgi:hypothetical protein